MRRYAGRRNGGVSEVYKACCRYDIWMLLPEVNHWEVGGRPQCDKCGCRVRNCSQHRFTTLQTISNYRNSYPGGSVVVVHEESHPQMTGHCLTGQKKQAADSRRNR
ncbi:hypothetical protein TNCV_3221391 [Trichonephila clavipes]|nr:hypothetical protein TNCV_3221391 [Trichonephila clavipes]